MVGGGRLRRNTLLLLTAMVLAVSILAAAFLLTRFGLPLQANPSPTSTISPTPTPTPIPLPVIVRNTNTTEEQRALAAAEDLNATDVFNLAPFTGGYACANFIDSEVINYYNNSYERSHETDHFSYSASVYSWNQTHAFYDNATSSVCVSSPNGTIFFPSASGWGSQGLYAYLNSSVYQEVSALEIDFSFPSCYVVEMNLGYSQFLGPTAGFMSNVYQIVIVNEDFEPVLLCVQSQQAVS